MTKKEPNIILYEPRIDYLNLYFLNLQVYVNAKFTICKRVDELIQAIKTTNPDLIFVGFTNEDKAADKLKKINEEVANKFVKPICYAQLKSDDTFSEFTIYDQDVPVKEIVSSVAKKMGITAKYMAELDVGEYYPLSLKYILPGWQATKVIYKKNADGKYEIALKKDEIFTNSFLESYGKENDVYCIAGERLEVINSFTSSIIAILDSNKLSVADRYAQTEVAFNMISQAVSTIGLPESTMHLARSSIRSMEKLVTALPSLSKLYSVLLSDNKSMRFKHSLLASYIGQYVLKDQSWNNPNIISQWSYLCFFHDIILDKDELLLYEYDEDIKGSKILTEREKSIVLNHAQMTSKLISQMKEIPIGIDTLIKQHHGSKMGNSLSEISMTISPLCIIFILVENYVQFLLSENERIKNPDEILSLVESLFKKYPYPNYKKMIPLLRSIPLKD
jgi:hypothetical protein